MAGTSGNSAVRPLRTRAPSGMPLFSASHMPSAKRGAHRPGSRLAALYGRADAIEEYQCNFGVNSAYRAALETGGLRFTAHDADGDPRALERANHPFFVATLFQMELSATAGVSHPVVIAFVNAARGSA